jgi:hypothetical protein
VGDEPGVDPDAMWKPDYSAPSDEAGHDDPGDDDALREWFADYRRTGAGVDAGNTPPVPSPAPDDGSTQLADASTELTDSVSRPRTARRLVGAALALTVVGIVGVAWQVSDDDAATGRHRLASIPTRAVPAWTAELDTGHVSGILGTRSMIVVLELVTNDLVGLAAESGVERWRVNVAPSRSIARLEDVGGAAVVLVEESSGDRWIASYDVESGERMWREDAVGRSAFVTFQGSIYRLPGGLSGVTIERIDPRNGLGLNALGPQLASVGWAHASTAQNDSVEVFDLQTLERVAGPIAIGDVAAASAFDGHVIGLGRDATIRLYGAAGDQLSSLQTTVDRPDQFDVTNTSEPVLLVMAEQEITGYSLADDRITQVWRTGPVQVYEISDVGDHTYAVVQAVVAAGPHGGPVRVVDAMTGVTVAEPRGGSSVRLGRDGFVVEIIDDEGVRLAIEAYGYDGVQRWRFDLARDQQDLFLVDGAVVVVASDQNTQTSTLTYLN